MRVFGKQDEGRGHTRRQKKYNNNKGYAGQIFIASYWSDEVALEGITQYFRWDATQKNRIERVFLRFMYEEI